MNVKLFYTGGPLAGQVHEIESSPVSETPDIVWGDYTITPVISIRPDENLDTTFAGGRYVFTSRTGNDLNYTWQP